MVLDHLLRDYVPGSHDQPWSWDDEERDLLSQPCPAASARENGWVGECVHGDACPGDGCYQLSLERSLAEAGAVTQPVCLGPDGRIWDGHHRIVAARRLGIDVVPIEE